MHSPLISIVTPVYNTDRRVLEECIASVLAQSDPNWELCLVDDASDRVQTRRVLSEASQIDPRIRVTFRQINGGIVAASNDGLAMATGLYVGLLDHDDVLEPDAVSEVLSAIRVNPSIDYVYSDEDLLGPDNKTREAFRKPDWSPERFRNQMYVCHFSVIRHSLLSEVGGFRVGFDGSQDYDLMLRVTERARVIHHIPKVLYHWRVVEGSVAGDPDAKPYAYTAGEKALRDHCARVEIKADVVADALLPGNYLISRHIPEVLPAIRVLVPDRQHSTTVWGINRDHCQASLASISTSSSYPMLRLESIEVGVGGALRALNAAVEASTEDFVVLTSDTVEVDTEDWCERLFSFMSQSDVGMVAPYLWTANSRLLHAGYNLRPRALETAGARISKDFTGFRAVFRCNREVSSLASYFTLVRRDAFMAAGGFDTSLPSPYAEADLSLKIRKLGYRLIVTPQVHMWCFEDNNDFSSGRYRMIDAFFDRWAEEIAHDRYAGLPIEGVEQDNDRPRWTPQRLRHYAKKLRN